MPPLNMGTTFGFLEVVDTPGDFRKAFLTEVSKVLNRAIKKAIPKVKADAATRLARFFYASPVYTSLLNGPLDILLGIPDGEAKFRVDTIIQTIINNIEYDFNPLVVRGGHIDGGLTISMLKSDFSDILSLPQSSVVDSNGTVLPWLEWLLIRGDSIIISNHQIQFGNYPASRSNQAIMVHSKIGWRVPPQYSGVINDNWLTRVIDRGINIIDNTITKLLEYHIANVLP